MFNSLKSNVEKKKNTFWGEVVQFILILIFVVIPFRFWVAQPFVVSGTSMQPNFETGDYLIIDQISYKFKEADRGDVIVFKYPNDPSKFFIKRIIGLPGETVTVKDEKVYITPKNTIETTLLDEPYTQDFRPGDISIIIPYGKYFVLGDNRLVSSDSRVWGLLDESLIKGQALFRLFPLNEIGVHPGDFTNYEIKLTIKWKPKVAKEEQ
jgi:signal peptidase I